MNALFFVLLAQSLTGAPRARPRPLAPMDTPDVVEVRRTEPTTPRPHAPPEDAPLPMPSRAEPNIDMDAFVRNFVIVSVIVIALFLIARRIGRTREPSIPASDELSKTEHEPVAVIRPPGVLGRRQSPAEPEAPTDPTSPLPPPELAPMGGWDPSVKRLDPLGESAPERAAAASDLHLAALWSQVHAALGHDRTMLAFHEGLGVWRAWSDAPTYEQAVLRGESRTKPGAVRVLRIVVGGVRQPDREFASPACRPSSRTAMGDTWTGWAVNRNGGAAHSYRAPTLPQKATARSR